MACCNDCFISGAVLNRYLYQEFGDTIPNSGEFRSCPQIPLEKSGHVPQFPKIFIILSLVRPSQSSGTAPDC